jgi:hypothetical protein
VQEMSQERYYNIANLQYLCDLVFTHVECEF